jgi:glucose/arabinose dehydrogenase
MTARRALWIALVALVAAMGACMPQGPAPTTTAPTTTAPTTTAPTTTAPPTSVPPPALSVVQTVAGFDRPWEVAVTPDGTVLVTERPGRLAAVVAGARHVVAPVPGVVAQGEGGLMGMALDPGFATNRRVYLCHAAGTGGVVSEVRIVRYRVAEDLASLTDPLVVLGGIPAGAGNRHLGCRLGFGPDGMLWATTGDAVLAGAPQDPTSRAGKVLRMTPDGAPAPGTATRRGSRSERRTARRSSPSTAPAVTTRSTWWYPAGTTAGTPSAAVAATTRTHR